MVVFLITFHISGVIFWLQHMLIRFEEDLIGVSSLSASQPTVNK